MRAVFIFLGMFFFSNWASAKVEVAKAYNCWHPEKSVKIYFGNGADPSWHQASIQIQTGGQPILGPLEASGRRSLVAGHRDDIEFKTIEISANGISTRIRFKLYLKAPPEQTHASLAVESTHEVGGQLFNLISNHTLLCESE